MYNVVINILFMICIIVHAVNICRAKNEQISLIIFQHILDVSQLLIGCILIALGYIYTIVTLQSFINIISSKI